MKEDDRPNSNGQKDTVYIDVDDEITAVIDKLKESPHKIVALVLPKRAAVFQSVVNMKLLKRTSETAKKNVVLITSEAALLPLAGAVGVHVAPNLQSKPEIPPLPSTKLPASEEAASATAAPASVIKPSDEESLEVDNQGPAEPAAAKKSKASGSPKGKKKIKIPNFEKFRNKLILGGAAAFLIIVGLVLAIVVLPRAKVALDTDTSNIDLNMDFVVDINAKAMDLENRILPGKNEELRVPDSEKSPATGQRDLGTKASGSVALQNCSPTTGSVTIPANTRITTGNLGFLTQTAVTLPESSFNGAGDCKTANQNVAVTAEQPGDQYNVSSGKSFSVAGYSNVKASNGNAFSGGTSNIVKIITQADVDAALKKIQDRANNSAPDELKDKLVSEDYLPLEATLVAGDPTITTSPNVGDQAGEVSVTTATSYTMIGVKEDELKRLIEADAKEQIDPETQVIRDDGLDDATISLREAGASAGQMPLVLKTKVVAGPNLDEDALKEELAGKNREEIEELLSGRPGINKVEVSFSPFWVKSAPKSSSKITIVTDNASNREDD